tara:strand:- start:574 stop:834 length:261 start_codon:yes stop_codon:yes gene_type:complete
MLDLFGRNRIADLEAKIDDLEHELRNLLRGFASVANGQISVETQMIGLRNCYADEFAEIDRQEKWSQDQLKSWIDMATNNIKEPKA